MPLTDLGGHPSIASHLSAFWATVCKTVRPICYETVVCPVHPSVTLVYCGQTIGWIMMPLGTEVGLGPGDTVLDGTSSPRKGAQQPHTFRPMSIVPKRSPISATAELLFFIQLCSS